MPVSLKTAWGDLRRSTRVGIVVDLHESVHFNAREFVGITY